VTRAEYRQVIRGQLTIAAVGLVPWGIGLWAFGWWGGAGGIAVGLANAYAWRRRHIELVRRLERKRR